MLPIRNFISSKTPRSFYDNILRLPVVLTAEKLIHMRLFDKLNIKMVNKINQRIGYIRYAVPSSIGGMTSAILIMCIQTLPSLSRKFFLDFTKNKLSVYNETLMNVQQGVILFAWH